jgi:hypothetical protein
MMPFPISQLNTVFIKEMVLAMYAWEAGQLTNPHLATEAEAFDFYQAYMGNPP